jgi:hypothetical protein
VKRKALFREVTKSQAKRFCLEPPSNSDDTTMAEYQQRKERDSLTVMIPFENIWRKTQEKVDNLEVNVSQHSKQIKSIEEQAWQVTERGVAGGTLQVATWFESRQTLLYMKGLLPLFFEGSAFSLGRPPKNILCHYAPPASLQRGSR